VADDRDDARVVQAEQDVFQALRDQDRGFSQHVLLLDLRQLLLDGGRHALVLVVHDEDVALDLMD
jgi:hypothetical protein